MSLKQLWGWVFFFPLHGTEKKKPKQKNPGDRQTRHQQS